ncbi:MAG: hypothetical protein ACREVZ_01875, partial [Burkholderiales bacterium]
SWDTNHPPLAAFGFAPGQSRAKVSARPADPVFPKGGKAVQRGNDLIAVRYGGRASPKKIVLHVDSNQRLPT